jgi:hypothetical protein
MTLEPGLQAVKVSTPGQSAGVRCKTGAGLALADEEFT